MGVQQCGCTAAHCVVNNTQKFSVIFIIKLNKGVWCGKWRKDTEGINKIFAF